jgi:3-hydroxyisobutyrate dehydrogenase
MKAGFIGLGSLGRAMAGRLMREGVQLAVWNRTKDKAEGLGADVAESPSALLSRADVVFLSLSDSAAVRAVIEGRGGLLEGEVKGKTIIDATTNHFDEALSFHRIFKERGASYLESPVLGSVAPASQGTLTFLVSGQREAFERALPYIEKAGNQIFFLGEPARATKMKLINNLVLGAFMASIAEALSFGEGAGIDREKVLDILQAGAGNSSVLNAKRGKLLEEDFSTHFSSALLYKDLHLMQDLARQMRRPLFTGSAVKELFAMTFPKGLDAMDISAVYRALKEL